MSVNNVYAEPDAPMTQKVGKEVATFLGATTIAYGENVPEVWKKASE